MNKDWIYVESKNDLPKERGDIWVVCQGKVFHYLDFDPTNNNEVKYCLQNYSYWQKYIKPSKPIFNPSDYIKSKQNEKVPRSYPTTKNRNY